MNTYYNHYTSQITKGDLSTIMFEALCKDGTVSCTKTDANTDKMKHIDYYIMKNNRQYGVDIKTRSRHGFSIEIANNYGFAGSIYGQQDYTVYVDGNTFYFVNPTKLLNAITPKLDTAIRNASDMYQLSLEDRYYKTFTRIDWGMKDQWAVIKDEDITNNATFTAVLKDQIVQSIVDERKQRIAAVKHNLWLRMKNS